MDELYGGIDLHSNNSFLALLNDRDEVVFEARLANDLQRVLQVLEPFRERIAGLVVESTFNWYWLVDGLMEAGYRVHLANTAAIKQYEGLKYTDDKSDARWLAHMLRLGILPEGYIYPKADRAVRDLLRKRMQLVRQRTAHILSIKGSASRCLGEAIRTNSVKRLTEADVEGLFANEDVALAVKSNVIVMQCLNEQVKRIERAVKSKMKLRPEFRQLLTVNGIGDILAMTISLEAGDIKRFPSVGDFASYCRCVNSRRESNKKKKAEGNRKNGNKYLAWAFVEAAALAIQHGQAVKRYYQRKASKTRPVVARKAVAHKLARACYWIMRDQAPFDESRAFAA